jgi:hypothetical protein
LSVIDLAKTRPKSPDAAQTTSQDRDRDLE